MMSLRLMSGSTQRKTGRFADSANLLAVQPVCSDLGEGLALMRESGRDRGNAGLSGEQNPYPLRT